MSGRKYTTIDSNELSRLRQDAAKLRGLRKDLPETIEKAVRDTQNSIDRRLSPIEDRQRKYEKTINGMSKEIREAETRSVQRIKDNAEQIRKALQEAAEKNETERRNIRQEILQTAEKIRNANAETEKRLTEDIRNTENRLIRLNEETRNAMYEQEQRLNAALEQERWERLQEVQAVNQRIDQIEETEERARSLADERIKDAEKLLDFIADNYQHEHFLPGELAKLESALVSAQNSLNQGVSQAALAQANTVFQDLSILRIELEKLDSEWRLWREQAIQTAKRILDEARANRTLSDVEGEGEIAEANYWTQGKMNELIAELEKAHQAAEDETYPMSIDEMREMVEKFLPEMDTRLDKIIEEAYLEIERSQLRPSIADVIAEKLEGQGYTVIDHTYEGDDMRSGFYIKAVNKAGSEIVAAVAPDGKLERITIDSFDAETKTDEELRDRMNTIAREMEKHDLQVGSLTQESKAPSQENKDLEKVRKRKPAHLQQQEKTTPSVRTAQ
ncbi:MAG TPA: hypothetical protein PLA02_10740 [Brevefilum fermentans]|jgi:hypothetical protein|nr:hypothetical protein [Brevefilum fermentans]